MVKGIVYAPAAHAAQSSALDGQKPRAALGLRWTKGRRAQLAPRSFRRGLSYWTDGRGDERILYVTVGYRLVELTQDRTAVAAFGKNGVVDLKEGVIIGKRSRSIWSR